MSDEIRAELVKCSDCGAVYAPTTVADGDCPACRAEHLEWQLFEARDQLEDALIDGRRAA